MQYRDTIIQAMQFKKERKKKGNEKVVQYLSFRMFKRRYHLPFKNMTFYQANYKLNFQNIQKLSK